MFLSKLDLNLRNTQVRHDLANPYEMHRTLLWAATDAAADGAEHLLWRLEGLRAGLPVLLVQTATRPDWQALLDRHPGYADVDPRSPKPYTPELSVGQRLHFRLRANASVKRDGRRHALRTFDDQLGWMAKQASSHGFELLNAVVSADERIQGRKGTDRITLGAILFDGILGVRDPEQAVATLESGIGHAKAFGLGLLSVASMGE